MIEIKIRPATVLISTMFTKPAPTVLKNIEEASANIPMNGYTIIAKIKQIIKLCIVLPLGILKGSTKPE